MYEFLKNVGLVVGITAGLAIWAWLVIQVVIVLIIAVQRLVSKLRPCGVCHGTGLLTPGRFCYRCEGSGIRPSRTTAKRLARIRINSRKAAKAAAVKLRKETL